MQLMKYIAHLSQDGNVSFFLPELGLRRESKNQTGNGSILSWALTTQTFRWAPVLEFGITLCVQLHENMCVTHPCASFYLPDSAPAFLRFPPPSLVDVVGTYVPSVTPPGTAARIVVRKHNCYMSALYRKPSASSHSGVFNINGLPFEY